MLMVAVSHYENGIIRRILPLRFTKAPQSYGLTFQSEVRCIANEKIMPESDCFRMRVQ